MNKVINFCLLICLVFVLLIKPNIGVRIPEKCGINSEVTFGRVGDQGVEETTWPSGYKGTMFYAKFSNNFPLDRIEWKIKYKSNTLNFFFQKTKYYCVVESFNIGC